VPWCVQAHVASAAAAPGPFAAVYDCRAGVSSLAWPRGGAGGGVSLADVDVVVRRVLAAQQA
jgi:hypothetical protein